MLLNLEKLIIWDLFVNCDKTQQYYVKKSITFFFFVITKNLKILYYIE